MGLTAMVAVSLISFFIYMVYDMIRSSGTLAVAEVNVKEHERGSNVSEISCEICLRPITIDGKGIECICGALFHGRCGKREGVCPECGREIMI
jgi:hypothetical protein